jgi:cell division protein FtsI/penicillin-binding protein 2
MPCPSSITINGQTVTNDFPDAHDDYKLADDFANSCNTAFINQGRQTLKPDSLPGIAKDVFGLNSDWKVGVPTVDSKVPATATANEMAAELFGQGKVTMNALSMASIAATVQSGTFHQPILVPGLAQQPAARTLSGSTLDALRAMMSRTAHSGTAAPAMAGLSGNIGAKTGTAEVDNKANNSWFTSYRGNLAVAAEVEGGGHGVDAAGPAAAKVLKVGNN